MSEESSNSHPEKPRGDEPEQKRVIELPIHVTVEGSRGSVWRQGSTAEVLATRIMEDRRYATLDRHVEQTPTHLAARMDDGDILVVLVENPEEADPDARKYNFSSIAMNKNRPGEPLRGIPLPPSGLGDVSFTPGEHVILGDKRSNSTVTEVVSWNSKRASLQNPDGSWRYPENPIWKDFKQGVGLE